MLKKSLLLAISTLFLLQINATSVFTNYGIPQTFNGRDIIGEGMGETGCGNLLRNNSSLYNPSLSVNSYYTVFSTAFSLGNITTKNNQDGGTFKSDESVFPYFNLIIPVYQHRFGFSYNSLGTGKYNSEKATTSTIGDMTEICKSDRTVYKCDFFYANKNDYVNLGVSASLYFGHNTNFYKADFTDETLTDTKYEVDETFKNPGFSLGLSKQINDNLSLGSVIAFPVTLDGDKKISSIAYSQNLNNTKYEIPAKISLGAAYRYAKNFNLAADIDYQLWSAVDTYKNSDNTLSFGIGTEYQGQEKSNNYFLKIPQRIGFSYKQIPLEPITSESHQAEEISGTYGISLPIKTHDSRIDLAVKIFNRSSNQTDFEENGFLISIGTVGFDIFKKNLDRKGHRDIPVADEN